MLVINTLLWVVQEVESYAGTKATVVGWGKTSGKEAKSSSRILQVAAEVNIWGYL